MVVLAGYYEGEDRAFEKHLDGIVDGYKTRGGLNLFGSPKVSYDNGFFALYVQDNYPRTELFGVMVLSAMFLLGWFNWIVFILGALMAATYFFHTNIFHQVMFSMGLRKKGLSTNIKWVNTGKAVERLIGWVN